MTARSRSKRPKDLKRTTGTRQELTTFRIYAEGDSTEPEYIQMIKKLPAVVQAVAIDITIEAKGMVPVTLVEHARTDKQSTRDEIDQYWCVFDVESPQPHPNLDRATQIARDNDIHTAISNPCFELWLILHLKAQNAYLSTDDAVRLRRELDSSDGKHLDPAVYRPKLQEAMVRASRLRKRHENDGTDFPQDNPSSSFDLFVSTVMRAAEDNTPQLDTDTLDR